MDFDYLERQDENFKLISNRIAFYYKEVFNIEILNLFYKKNLKDITNKNINLPNYLEALTIEAKVRKERRTAEDNVDLLNRIGSQFSFTNKKKAKNILKSKKENIKTRKYSTRYYSEKSLIEIAKKSKEKNNDN